VTIPVENPPRYEPGAPPPPPSEEEARELAQRTGVQLQLQLEEQRARAATRRPLARGCFASALTLGLLASCCGAFVAWAVLGGGVDAALRQTGEKISQDLRLTAEEQGAVEEEREALDHFDRLVREQRVTWIAFSILFNRWSDARSDRQITPEERAHIMRLVRDIDAHEGDVDPAVYPEGR
jgi:hypothetical protein